MKEKNFTVPVGGENYQVTDRFTTRLRELVREKVISYQWEALNDRVKGAERWAASPCCAARAAWWRERGKLCTPLAHRKSEQSGSFSGSPIMPGPTAAREK